MASITTKKENKMKKINEKEALLIAEKLHDNKCELSPDEKKQLLYYFAPPTPRVPKNRYDWLARFVAKKDVRHFFKYIYVDNDNIVGCNGHRLGVIANTEGLKNGYYTYFNSKLKTTSSDDIEPTMKYADYKSLIGGIKSYEYTNQKMDNFVKDGVFLTNIDDLNFQTKYLNLLSDCQCYIDANADTGYFKSEFGYALVKGYNA